MALNIVSGGVGRAPRESSRELQRILALPRRRAPKILRSVRELENGGRFFKKQAQSLSEARKVGGLFAGLGVGEGKTLVSLAIPSLFPNATCLLLVPAKLVSKTKREWAEYAEEFELRDDIIVTSYAKLSSHTEPEWLWRIAPDIIIADEAHKLARYESARTNRFLLYMKERAKKGNPVKFFAMSGTITRKSVADYAHLVELALGERSPLPRPLSGWYGELKAWGEVLDADGALVRQPGGLAKLARDGESVRQGFQRRMRDTRGVVFTDEVSIGTSLTIEVLPMEPTEKTKTNLMELKKTWTRADGWEVSHAVELFGLRRQYLLGGYYAIQWPDDFPVFDWLSARGEWARDCRAIIKTKKRFGLDTEGLVVRAIERGDVDARSYVQWRTLLLDYPMPHRKWKTLDGNQYRNLVDSIKSLPAPGLIWCGLVAPARRIAKKALLPYLGQGAKCRGVLERAKEKPKSLALSYRVFGEGNNLQAWSHNYLAECPSSGAAMEQILGRTHRRGQQADEVNVYLPSWWEPELARATKDAHYIQETTGNRQRLLMADIIR